MLKEIFVAGVLLTAPVISDTALFVDEYQTEDLSFLKETPVAIMGDSISTFEGASVDCYMDAAYPDSSVTDQSMMWWSDLNHQAISAVSGSYIAYPEEGEWLQFNSDERVGYLGDTEWVIIYGGTNDMLANVSTDNFKSGLASLVSNVQYGGKRTTVLCTLPPSTYKTTDGETYKDYNEAIREVAKDTGSKVCDFSRAWSHKQTEKYTEDGVHPNAEGMAKLKKAFDKKE